MTTKKSVCGTTDQGILGTLNDMLLVFGRKGRILYANGTVCRLLGWSLEQLLKKDIGDIVAAPYSRMLPGRIKRLKAEGEVFTLTAYRKRGGGSVTMNARYNLSSAGGKPCVICVARPVSKRDSLHDPRASGERYRRLIDGLRSEYFFFQHQPGRYFSYVSPSVKDVLGYTPEYFSRHYAATLTDNPDNKKAIKLTQGTLKGIRPAPYLVEVRHAAGAARWLEVANVPVRDELGALVSVEGIARDVTARIKARQELERYRSGLEKLVQERTGELKAVFERTPVLMLLLDSDLKVLRTNSPSRRGGLIGEVLRCVNAKGGNCGRGRHCGGCPVRGAIRSTLTSGTPVTRSQSELRTSSGRRVYFLLSTALIKHGGGTRLLLCLDDITPQKEAEESLRKSEEFRRLVLGSVGDGIIGVDGDGKILFMNDAAENMLGWKLEELRGKNLHATIHNKKPDGSPYPLAECPMFAAYTERKETPAHDEMLWRRDGTGFYVRYSARPMYANGQVSGAVIAFSDISDRRRIEQELLDNKERLQAQNSLLTSLGRDKAAAAADLTAAFRDAVEAGAQALDADRVGVWLFNDDRSALVCRDMFDRPSGTHSSGAALPRAGHLSYFRLLESERILVSDDAAADFRLRELRDDYLAPAGVASALDVSVSCGARPAGIIRAERLGRARPWRLDEQNMIGALSDFAALAISSAERVKLEKMKDFLTHTIVHDLKNPLASVICAADLLSEGLRRKLSKEERESLDILMQQAEEMRRMISNILDINRMEEGKLKLNVSEFPAARLLEEAARTLKMAGGAENKRIRVRPVPRGLGPVRGDAELLRRVLENLLANALKFAPRGTVVETGAAAVPGGAEFYVSDKGAGIPYEYHTRIFEKFVQLEDPGPRKWGGKGLGLAFCKQAVEAHGGRIRVESAPGEGSVFRFTVPGKPPAA